MRRLRIVRREAVESLPPETSGSRTDVVAESETSPEGSRSRDVGWLLLCCAVLGAAFCLNVLPGGCVSLRGFETTPFPQVCLSRSVLGVECPFCGLTRSFVYLARGRWTDSLAVHPLGWLVALMFVAQVPLRLLAIGTGRKLHALRQLAGRAFWLLVLLLGVVWIVRIVTSLL